MAAPNNKDGHYSRPLTNNCNTGESIASQRYKRTATGANRKHKDSFLDTLAQSGTNLSSNPEITLYGVGSDLMDENLQNKRAKRKMIGSHVSMKLIEAAKAKNENDPMIKSFRNAYYCQDKIRTHDGRIYTNYCKTRYCPTCLRIRQAEMINKYWPVIESWPMPFFVTLTFKSCPKHKLKMWVDAVLRGFKKLRECLKKRHQRGTGLKFMCVRSLECNFNAVSRTYNPHFHLLVPDEETAELVIETWLQYCTPLWATKPAQDKRPVKSTKKDLIETIKYGCKIINEPNDQFKERQRTGRKRFKGDTGIIYAAALNNIYQAFKGRHLLAIVGFRLPKSETSKSRISKTVNDFQTWEYDIKRGDWFNDQLGIPLTEFSPTSVLMGVLENIDVNIS